MFWIVLLVLWVIFAESTAVYFYTRTRVLETAVETQKAHIESLRAELLTSFGETQTALEEKAKVEAYNRRLLDQLIAQNSQGCRVNPGNPNVVRTQQTN